MVSNEQRRKQLARQKYLRQQARRAQVRRRARVRNTVIGAFLVLALGASAAAAAAGALGGDDKKDSADKARESASPSPTSKAPDPCSPPAKGKPGEKQWEKEPKMSIDASAEYTMTLSTTCGDIIIDLDAKNAPHTVNSFNFLAGEGYFDHTTCHRLVTEGIHVLQCGDPTGSGRGGPGYTIPDENLKSPKIKDNIYPAGTVAMANRYNAQTGDGKNSGGSQFFLVYEDSELPPYYTPFGTVTEGMDVLQEIVKAGTTPDPQTGNSAPSATVVINEATVGAG